MIASLQWSGCYQQQCESFLRQLDCSCFGYTSPQLAGTLLIDLGADLRGVEISCEGDELDLYVDLPFSPLEDTGKIDVQKEGWNGTLSMEEGRTSVVDQRACSADMHQGRMSGDGLTCVHCLQSPFDENQDENVVSQSNTYCIGPDNADKQSVSEEKPHRRRFSGSNRVVTASDQNFVEVRKSYQLPSLPQSSNECVRELSQKVSGKRLGKRACGVPEIENSKRRKVSEPARVLNSQNECQSSFLVMEKSKSSSRQWQREASKLRIESGGETRIGGGKDALLDVKRPPKGLCRSQPSFIHEDINREEAALELQQCVSLLRKYGVLKNRDFYISQNLPSCVPHPGFVGDGQQPKVCKTCGAVEDTNGTVICDECQEAFHLSCCLPRMSSKYFDREDDWYCNSCKKQKKKTGSKFSTEGFSCLENFNSFKMSRTGLVDGSGSVFPVVGISYNSKVRLGSAHQADVPMWTGNVEVHYPELAGAADCPGMEVPLSQEEKETEKDLILETFKNKIQSLNWIPAKMLPNGMPENWLQCQSVLHRAFKDSDGRKHSEVLCGKWRRAPLDCKQTDSWECFCVIEWDPVHADCAVPQELLTEEILKRIQTKVDDQASEVFLSRQNI